MVDGLIAAHHGRYQRNTAELVMGNGRFVAPKTSEVTVGCRVTRILRGNIVVICTGSGVKIDHICGLAEAKAPTHVEVLELDRVPERLLILGARYVGLQMAQVFRRFGSRVMIVERNDVLAHKEDPDVSESIRELFHDEGIEIRARAHLERLEGQSGDFVKLHIRSSSTLEVIEGADLLVATDRKPNNEGIGLEAADVELDDQGFVKVDERLRTTARGVWAVGDCAGGPQFMHIGYDDFRMVRDNLPGIDRITTGRLVPHCMFLDTEVAHVGLSEAESKRRGIANRVTKLPVTSIRRRWTLSEAHGFYKALIAADRDRILGFTAFAPQAGEVMAIVQVAIAANQPCTVLRDSIMTHPTMAEGLVAHFRSVPAADPNLFPRLKRSRPPIPNQQGVSNEPSDPRHWRCQADRCIQRCHRSRAQLALATLALADDLGNSRALDLR
jgi:pyruvate/2-oxoglutarate dehydrogenase complex dihydrolipoamide dehydrogenase (E3) component